MNTLRDEHIPNKITRKVVRESEEGKTCPHISLEDFWKDMDIDPNASVDERLASYAKVVIIGKYSFYDLCL